MANSGERTERPTPRRLDRARREGNFPASREFVASVQFLGFVALIAVFGSTAMIRMERLTRALLAGAFSGEMTIPSLAALLREVALPALVPLLAAGGALMALALFAQLGATRVGVSLKKLAPDLQRLNPVTRLGSLPAQNLFMFCQAIVLLALVGAIVYYEIAENLDSFMRLPWTAPQPALAQVSGTLAALLWRAAGLFLAIGVADLIWQRRRYTQQLRMSKQEVREEVKEQESSPHVKMRIRRIQRDLARRRMMKEIPTATTVIVNPTHYAVAIRYAIDSPAAPRVIAKGKNYLASRIRQRAIEHQVPIVENPPLARALYASVEVGQEIPAHLYRAVAEILAYIYRLMNGRLPG